MCFIPFCTVADPDPLNIPFCINKNNAQITQESIKNPRASRACIRALDPAITDFELVLVLSVCTHNLLSPPPSPQIKILDPPLFSLHFMAPIVLYCLTGVACKCHWCTTTCKTHKTNPGSDFFFYFCLIRPKIFEIMPAFCLFVYLFSFLGGIILPFRQISVQLE